MVKTVACASAAGAFLAILAGPAPAAERDWGYRPRVTKDGWEVLFDGTTLDAWDHRNNWKITDEKELFRAGGGGDIYTKRRYCDFVLDLEFKVDRGTNSGVFIRMHSRADWLNTGIELQVLDSAGKANPGKHDTGSVYDIQAPSENAMRPAGEWNRYVITADENMLTVELNGRKVNELDLDRWTEARKNPDGSGNKFKFAYKEIVREGVIALQDHGNPVWYRNVRIKELNDRKPRYTGNERTEDLIPEERQRQAQAMVLREERKRREAERKVAPKPAKPPAAEVDSAVAESERLYKMGRDAERMGQRAAAKTFYKRIVEDYPDTEAAKQAAARLKKLGG